MKTTAAIASLTALSHEARLLILRCIVDAGSHGTTVGRIGEVVNVTPATLSFHLKELSSAGLVKSRRAGRFHWYSANHETMIALITYLSESYCRVRP
jgi:DNA-binding transcriptional ArsR family regulator